MLVETIIKSTVCKSDDGFVAELAALDVGSAGVGQGVMLESRETGFHIAILLLPDPLVYP